MSIVFAGPGSSPPPEASRIKRTTVFKKVSSESVSYTQLEPRFSIKSKLACAADCDRIVDCDQFLFNTDTANCLLFRTGSNQEHLLFSAPWILFREHFTCPNDFTDALTIGICYKIYTQNANWYNARSTCQEAGYDLIMIDTLSKLNYFKNNLPWDDYHIGAWKSGGDFRWLSSGSTIDSNLWGSGCPDNPNSEKCIALTTFSSLNLNDIHCTNYAFNFICEAREPK
ncbi:hypothetical protein RRG08_065990 [Elysia crispata]|uniref:C-type lectin domain-containing protein n=1 Tax=Elysia crispata TaxID=231223 RepID=A0AAE1DSH4_9GAST|nr:hypothetical protein RRG08_065990 [Elysia crispata]